MYKMGSPLTQAADPEFFWPKILPEMQQQNPEAAEALLNSRREKKQVKRFGMADEGEAEEFLDELSGKRRKGERGVGYFKGDEEARRAARRAMSHIWSKVRLALCAVRTVAQLLTY